MPLLPHVSAPVPLTARLATLPILQSAPLAKRITVSVLLASASSAQPIASPAKMAIPAINALLATLSTQQPKPASAKDLLTAKLAVLILTNAPAANPATLLTPKTQPAVLVRRTACNATIPRIVHHVLKTTPSKTPLARVSCQLARLHSVPAALKLTPTHVTFVSMEPSGIQPLAPSATRGALDVLPKIPVKNVTLNSH
jgi:hypothetical protein